MMEQFWVSDPVDPKGLDPRLTWVYSYEALSHPSGLQAPSGLRQCIDLQDLCLLSLCPFCMLWTQMKAVGLLRHYRSMFCCHMNVCISKEQP